MPSRSERVLIVADGIRTHSAIEWTEATWNPTSGCTKVSPGCDRCYAERVTRRFPKSFPRGFTLTVRPDALDTPLRWKRPRVIFVNSMSDLFHKDVSDDYVQLVFDVMVSPKSERRLGVLRPRGRTQQSVGDQIPKRGV